MVGLLLPSRRHHEFGLDRWLASVRSYDHMQESTHKERKKMKTHSHNLKIDNHYSHYIKHLL